MTDAEKKMKNYTSTIERRLELPRDVKVRVMSDLISSIEARREEGKSDEEIYLELGSPKAVAKELNAQMKEFAYRKSPWRFLFAAAAIYGVLELLGSLAAWLLALLWTAPGFSVGEAASVGIIGGADGPTAVFVTTPGRASYLVPMAMVIIGIWGYRKLKRCQSK